jgi:hypothetical protein
VAVALRHEPDDEARAAIVAALARAGLGEASPPAYESPWRAAALRDAAEPDEPEP